MQKALGQDNIDELLKLSEDYKKGKSTISPYPDETLIITGEMEVAAARSSAGNVVEERKEEIFVPPAATQPAPAAALAPAPAPAPAPGPVIVDAAPPRDTSPSRTTTTTSSYDTHHYHHHHDHHEASRPVPVGPLALAERSRSRSRSRGGREIRAEIRALERELVHRPKRETGERELVRAERLPDGQLVVYEEQVDVEHTHKPARIEKDRKGRLSLSVPHR